MSDRGAKGKRDREKKEKKRKKKEKKEKREKNFGSTEGNILLLYVLVRVTFTLRKIITRNEMLMGWATSALGN